MVWGLCGLAALHCPATATAAAIDPLPVGVGTVQSERFYAALKGNGAACRLVILPHESHGYRCPFHTLFPCSTQGHMHTLEWTKATATGAPPTPPFVSTGTHAHPGVNCHFQLSTIDADVNLC